MSTEVPDGSVILCWDGSASAGRAIQHASRILGEGRKAVVLFAHVPVEEHAGVLGGTQAPDAPILGPADAEDLLEEGVRVARAAGFTATGRRIVADRKTAEIIVAAAEAENAPLIVMGQRGRSGLRAALLGLGSVAQQVLATYDGPVLLVGRDGG